MDIFELVLIVAKCIVNTITVMYLSYGEIGINSSKVYCKFQKIYLHFQLYSVLIVAKCIVNLFVILFNIFIIQY